MVYYNETTDEFKCVFNNTTTSYASARGYTLGADGSVEPASGQVIYLGYVPGEILTYQDVLTYGTNLTGFAAVPVPAICRVTLDEGAVWNTESYSMLHSALKALFV